LIHRSFRKDAERFYRRQFARRLRNTDLELPVLTKDGAERWLGQNVQLSVAC
jgi:hypothetical protein